MNKLRRLMEDGVQEPVPGEAPAEAIPGSVLNEPNVGGGSSGDFSMDDFLQLYPDITSVDITSPCALADYFGSLCDQQQSDMAAEEKAKIVPSSQNVDTPEEFM